MKKLEQLGALSAVVFSLAPIASYAALIPIFGGQVSYDDVADLTWLADANAAGSTMMIASRRPI